VVAALAFWCKRVVDSMSEPLFGAWQTRVIPSEGRATVLSALGQGDAVGQVLGGPVVGAIGTVMSIRAAQPWSRQACCTPACRRYSSVPEGSATHTLTWNVSPRSDVLDPVRRLRQEAVRRDCHASQCECARSVRAQHAAPTCAIGLVLH